MDQRPGDIRRYRAVSGPVYREYASTPISVLRQVYGPKFAKGLPGASLVGQVLRCLDDASLRQLIDALYGNTPAVGRSATVNRFAPIRQRRE